MCGLYPIPMPDMAIPAGAGEIRIKCAAFILAGAYPRRRGENILDNLKYKHDRGRYQLNGVVTNRLAAYFTLSFIVACDLFRSSRYQNQR